MTIALSAGHRRYLAIETAIAATINAILSAGFALLVFGDMTRVPVAGAHGLIVDALPQTFMVALMSMLVPTLLTRRRRRRGTVSGLPGRPVAGPHHPLLRALIAAVPVTVFAGVAHALLLPLGPADWPFRIVIVAKTLYGGMLGGALSFAAVHVVLRDDIGPRRPSAGPVD